MDISCIIKEWAIGSKQNFREIADLNGRKILQIRLDHGPFQGILQMYLEGRPDGIEPDGFTSTLDQNESLLEKTLRKCGDDSQFYLNNEQLLELNEEADSFYERYSLLLTLSDYKRVIRDTNHNIRLYQFIHNYARNKSELYLLQLPLTIRMNGTAKAMLAIEINDFNSALKLLLKTRKRIKQLELKTPAFVAAQEQALNGLLELEKSLQQSCPASEHKTLIEALKRAIVEENYETAALIRDKLKSID